MDEDDSFASGQRIVAKAEESKQAAVNESILICCEALQTILAAVDGCGVPLGVSVESVSGFTVEDLTACVAKCKELNALQ